MAAHMDRGLHMRLVDSLYVEAMVMADEARSYFAVQADADRDDLPLLARVAFSCESLKVTTRLMHVIAWLMAQRGWQRGEITDGDIREERYRLGEAARPDLFSLLDFPVAARTLITGSGDLYERVARLAGMMEEERDETIVEGPARALMGRLARLF